MPEERRVENVFVPRSKIISLKGKANFELISSKGLSKKTPHFTLVYRKNNIDVIRLGIITTRRIGNAVVRNRIRRIIKAEIGHFIKDFIDLSYDLLIIIRGKFLEIDDAEARYKLRVVLENLLTKDAK